MFLKSIEIFGFKSFADRARVDFVDGISALLGPNGCGKSNVVDAIKWVLGEQASRSLRAEKMEDVIFNGTEARRATNVAEVTLTLSNEQNFLNLDLPEIAVKRRLYRSGESEYFINATPVKLKEVRELFMDTGVGKSAYSIMEQGRIDQILSSKAEERRYIFEEAAGITKYKVRGQEAEKKLEKTEENLRQIESILSEVKRNHDSLKVQAEKTTQYRALRKDIFDIEKNIQLLRLKDFVEQRAGLKTRLGETTDRRNGLKKEIDDINNSLEKSLDQVSQMEAQLIEVQKKLYGLDLEKNSLDSQGKMMGERLAQIAEHIAASESRGRSLVLKLAEVRAEMAAKKAELEENREKIKEITQNISEFQTNIETSQLRIQDNDQQVTQWESSIAAWDGQAKTLQTELRAVTDDLVTQLDQKLKEAGINFEELNGLDRNIDHHLDTLGVFLDGRTGLLSDIVATGQIPGGDALAWLKGVHNDFVGARDTFGALRVQLEKYRKSSPSFLSEFLSPQGIITKKRELETGLEKLVADTAQARESIKNLVAENVALRQKIEDYRQNLEELKMAQVRMTTQNASLEDQNQRLSREEGTLQISVQENERDIEENRRRIIGIEENLKILDEQKQALGLREQACKDDSARLEKEITERNQSLLGNEKELKSRMEALNNLQSQVEDLQMQAAQLETEIRNIYDNFRDKHSVELADYEKELDRIEAPSRDLRDLLAGKKESLKAIGQVNLMAPEEFAEVEQRFKFLTEQLTDLRKAREDLHQVTKEIRKESSALFEAAFAEIKKHFNTIFRRLFGGGRAELKLSEPDNVLESGIDMFCQPPGKKLENINLLSGGERSMTAVALLFATFMVKPSPFCILDEIDAALDEANVGRFVNMLMEFGEKSQFIVITHNKKTVAGANTMIGVTMEESGVSKIISIKLNDLPKKEVS